jgi:predicted ester cyclase
MSQTVLRKPMPLTGRHSVECYFETHDVQYLANDPVFIDMNTGHETRGKEAIAEMLHFIYHVAFDAHAVIRNKLITHKHAILEFTFSGIHTGEFAGIAPTHRNVEVPCTVVYDLENGFIKTARIYMLQNVLIQQISS